MEREPIETQAVTVRDGAGDVVKAADFMPLLTVDQAVERKSQINQFIGKVMREGEDYGLMPGNQTKKVLMKPGAEKLCSIFGMAPTYERVTVVEDWTGAEHGGEPLFYYEYRCQLSRGGRFMGEAIGSCNSWESKYRYRWVSEDIAKQRSDWENLPTRGGKKTIFEPIFALDRAETTGKYGHPPEYWARFRAAAEDGTAQRTKKKLGAKDFDGYQMTVDETQYRIPNPDVADVVNTCQKMAQKRALVAAVLIVTNCSDAFTQDVEDFVEPDHAGPAPAVEPTTTKQGKPEPEPKQHDLPGTQIDERDARVVPEELVQIFKDIDADKRGTITTAIDMFERQFARRGPAALKKYQELCAAHRAAVPKEKESKGSLKVFLLDLWDTLGALPLADAGGASSV